ncbi:hypothetical protein ACJ2A9_19400 [Anaerobacillus sp. MEB173]|uniref:hypothetical protein n=1 Tax=Anaerobacillus sp. MEB173 TaxID=3383345 RepID=UPI003F8FC1C3
MALSEMEKSKFTNFEELITTHGKELMGKHKVLVGEEIPEKKLAKAIASYGEGVSPSNVLVLCDASVFGTGKDGFIITKAGFYYKEFTNKPIYIPFGTLINVTKEEKKIHQKNKDPKVELLLHVELEEEKLDFPIDPSYLNGKAFFDFLTDVIHFKKTGEVDETDKIVILEDMSDEVKVNYLKVIVQYVLSEYGEVDGVSLSEIQTLMTQLNFTVELRHEVRSYIANVQRELEELLLEMEVSIPTGSEEALQISLIKDVIRVMRIKQGDIPAISVETVRFLAKRYDLNDSQIEVIEQGIRNDEKIMRGEVKDDQIIKNAKDLAAKAGAVGVPIAAIYMSGSVVGLSAAGITSGLAALGLGGVLGLSSMVTGIGVLLIVGVGVYKGIQWLTGGSERSKTQKREFFIQEIIKNNQKTINNLAEDVNFFAEQVVSLIHDKEVNQVKIEKLGKELQVFTRALKTLQEKGINLEEVLHQKE